jgi:hypothetical protein
MKKRCWPKKIFWRLQYLRFHHTSPKNFTKDLTKKCIWWSMTCTCLTNQWQFLAWANPRGKARRAILAIWHPRGLATKAVTAQGFLQLIWHWPIDLNPNQSRGTRSRTLLGAQWALATMTWAKTYMEYQKQKHNFSNKMLKVYDLQQIFSKTTKQRTALNLRKS